jgi:hypothetical protein
MTKQIIIGYANRIFCLSFFSKGEKVDPDVSQVPIGSSKIHENTRIQDASPPPLGIHQDSAGSKDLGSIFSLLRSTRIHFSPLGIHQDPLFPLVFSNTPANYSAPAPNSITSFGASQKTIHTSYSTISVRLDSWFYDRFIDALQLGNFVSKTN